MSAGGDTSDRVKRLAELDTLIAVMAEAVALDGGDLRLVDADPDTGVVSVELSGACSSCAISAVTLTDGVRRALMDRLEWVTDVRGSVDDTIDSELSASLGRGAYVPG